MRWPGRLFALLFVLYFLLSGCSRPKSDEEGDNFEDEGKGLRVGSVAPEIEGLDLDGENMALSDYRGKVVLLSFWMTT